MKKTKKLLAMITLITMTSTLAFQTEISAAVINQTKDNKQIQELETKDELQQVQEDETKDESQQVQESETKDDVQSEESETKEDIEIKETEIKDNTQIQEIETNENIDSIEAVKRYEENLENLYAEKEASSTALSILSFSSDLKSPQEKGKTIKLTAKAQGGTGTIKYSFVEKINGNYKEIKAYSETNTVSWKPQYVGTYTMYVVAKDSTGRLKISSMNYIVKAKTIAISSFTTSKASPQEVGTQIGLTAKATGEGTLQYRFRVGDGNGNYSTIRNYSTSNTATWNANYVGNKILCVDVKDSNGKVATKTINYVVKAKPVAPKISSFTTNKTSPQIVGTQIGLTAKATGEGTLQY
ncbi:MAG: hypothetical protein SOY42_11855, partial [Clostridium sp.]|nr:hypothetical protein [Clostridium sp.]